MFASFVGKREQVICGNDKPIKRNPPRLCRTSSNFAILKVWWSLRTKRIPAQRDSLASSANLCLTFLSPCPSYYPFPNFNLPLFIVLSQFNGPDRFFLPVLLSCYFYLLWTLEFLNYLRILTHSLRLHSAEWHESTCSEQYGSRRLRPIARRFTV